ncbi:MAG: thioredoxin family protein [Deltaproteobacteria bacterium]|nr:thioredoxin family protein [Deltaproteobacteria bacterium]
MLFTERLATSLQESLAGGQLSLALGAAFLGGLLTSFTGCVYPLIPITVRYFGAMRGASRLHVFLRAISYVGGMVILYASLGTASASMQMVFGAALASPLVIAIIAAFCFAMGLSMLGLFTIQLPTDVNTRLTRIGGNGVGGAFLMGLVSGIIAAPCTGPVLAVILALIAVEHSIFFGFALMISFGLGMGLPFLALALFGSVFANFSMAKEFFGSVKIALASIMFIVAIYFLDIAVPQLGDVFAKLPKNIPIEIILFVIGLAAMFFYQSQKSRLRSYFLKIIAVLSLSTAGSLIAVDRSIAIDNHANSQISSSNQNAGNANSIEYIKWELSHDVAIAKARAQNLPVIIDFGAEWCEACKELEIKTYVDPLVRKEAQRFVTIKIDATNINDDMQKILDLYEVMGLPTVLFIDSTGKVLKQPRVLGFVPPKRFVEIMKLVQ